MYFFKMCKINFEGGEEKKSLLKLCTLFFIFMRKFRDKHQKSWNFEQFKFQTFLRIKLNI